MSETISVRIASREDIPSIYQLVRELAIYEKAEEQLLVNSDYYFTEFDRGTFESIVAVKDEKVIGTCIYYMTFSTWKGRMLYLEDFVVSEFHRKKGIGQKLYDQFIQIAKEKSCTMVKWQVLDWNEPAVNFYKKNGATIEKGWWNAKIIF